MSMIIDPFRFRPPDAEIIYCGYRGDISFAATVTVNDIAIGDEADDRVVFLGVLKGAAPEFRSLVSATIGGVEATIQANNEEGISVFDIYWISAPVPSGTTATVSLVFSANTSGGGRVYISSFAGYKLQSIDPVDVYMVRQTGGPDSAVTQTFNVASERGGIVLFAAWASIYQAVTHLTLGGVEENFQDIIRAGTNGFPQNQFFLGGCAQTDADNPSYEITVTSPNPAYEHYDIPVAISFR